MSCAGLVPIMGLAQDCDFAGLVAEQVKLDVPVGVNAHLKVRDAEVAEIGYTAFTSTRTHAVTARLIVRRVRRLAPPRQGALLPAWRHHAIVTDSPLPMPAAETDHRDHAIIEQVIADLVDGPLAHLPSGDFAANAAWLTCAAIAHNLLRAAATWPRGATGRPAAPPCAAS